MRKKSYKTGVDAEEARRRREDNLVEIRKNKREDSLLKKRREGLSQSQQQLLDGSQSTVVLEKRVLLRIFADFCLKVLSFNLCFVLFD